MIIIKKHFHILIFLFFKCPSAYIGYYSDKTIQLQILFWKKIKGLYSPNLHKIRNHKFIRDIIDYIYKHVDNRMPIKSFCRTLKPNLRCYILKLNKYLLEKYQHLHNNLAWWIACILGIIVETPYLASLQGRSVVS